MMTEKEFQAAALAILTAALRRGLRAKSAYKLTFKAVAGFDTNGYCWAVPAIPTEFIAKWLTKKQDRSAAEGADCGCIECGGTWRSYCEKDPHLWAMRRREMHAYRRRVAKNRDAFEKRDSEGWLPSDGSKCGCTRHYKHKNGVDICEGVSQ